MSGTEQQVNAIFGGTFDPVHYGHLRAALEIRSLLNIDSITLMPSGSPAHRTNTVSPVRHRVEMLKMAVAGLEGFKLDLREVERNGPSFTVESLLEIRQQSADIPIICVIGQDSANTLNSWHRWKELFSLAHLVIMSRPGDLEDYPDELANEFIGRKITHPASLFDSLAGQVLSVPVTGLAISSKHIRALLERGETPRFLLPDTVLAYIRQIGLYDSD